MRSRFRPIPPLRWRPGLYLLFFLLFVNWLQPPPVLITPGPQQRIQTTYPGLGVHTRLTDEVEEWKIQRTLQLVRQMGATRIVEFFPWAYYQGVDGRINWDHPDAVVEHAQVQGLKVIARIGLIPAWARPEDTPLTYLEPAAYDDFAAFAAAFAGRYRGRVEAIIVGNEPNLTFEWGYRQTTAADYVALLRTVYPAVKAAAPETLVLGGALAPTLEPEGSPWGINDLDYLDAMYRAGAAPFFDGLAVHVYGLTAPPAAEPGREVLNFRRVELMREIMIAHGDDETQVYITETGWNDHPRWTQAVGPAQRIVYTLDALRFVEAEWPFVEMVAIWAFRYPAPTGSYMDYYTLVSPDFVPRPLYYELQAFTGNEDEG